MKPVFDGKTIGRMEVFVMKTLKWRMQAVTPFAFLSYFLNKLSEGKPPSFALASQCAEIIVGTLKGLLTLALSLDHLMDSFTCIANGSMFRCTD